MKMDSALNNQQSLICHKTQPTNQSRLPYLPLSEEGKNIWIHTLSEREHPRPGFELSLRIPFSMTITVVQRMRLNVPNSYSSRYMTKGLVIVWGMDIFSSIWEIKEIFGHQREGENSAASSFGVNSLILFRRESFLLFFARQVSLSQQQGISRFLLM